MAKVILYWNADVVVEGQGNAVLLSFVDMVQCSAKRYGYSQASF
jgi:C4-dicarboxylate transporter